MSDQQAQEQKKTVSIAGLQQDLKDGLDRNDIAKKYGVPKAEVSRWFQHEKLKGLKVKAKPMFELVDDAPPRKTKAVKKDAPVANVEEVAQAETDATASATTDTGSATANLTNQPAQPAQAQENQPQAEAASTEKTKGVW